MRVLSFRRARKVYASKAVTEILPMEHLDSRETLPERSHRASRKHGDPILPPFAVPDKNLSVAEIHVPDPESNTLHQS